MMLCCCRSPCSHPDILDCCTDTHRMQNQSSPSQNQYIHQDPGQRGGACLCCDRAEGRCGLSEERDPLCRRTLQPNSCTTKEQLDRLPGAGTQCKYSWPDDDP